MEKRVLCSIRLTDSNFKKVKKVSEDAWLNMTSFINMLIATYKKIEITTEDVR